MTGDREERTNPVGLYHYACSYHEAARVLDAAKVRATHPDAPVSFLYFHAIELFLKSYLRLHGHSVADLEKRFGHSISRMRNRVTELGFEFMDEDLLVFDFMEQTDVVISSRYIRTGAFTRPTNEALERTAASLRETTCGAVRQVTGVNVRP